MSQYESQLGSRYGVREQGGRMSNEMKSYFGQTYHNVEEMVTHHPATSALVVFGVGMGLGFLLGSALASAIQPSRSRWIDARRAEKFGRQMLDAIARYMPEPLANRIT